MHLWSQHSPQINRPRKDSDPCPIGTVKENRTDFLVQYIERYLNNAIVRVRQNSLRYIVGITATAKNLYFRFRWGLNRTY